MWIRMIVRSKSDSSWISEREHMRSEPQLESFPKGAWVGRHRLLLKNDKFLAEKTNLSQSQWDLRGSGFCKNLSEVRASVRSWVESPGEVNHKKKHCVANLTVWTPPQSTSYKNLRLNQPTRLRGVSEKAPQACDMPFKVPGSIDACLIRPFWKGPTPIQRLPISPKLLSLSFKLTA